VGSFMTYTIGVFLAASGRGGVRRELAGVVRVPAIYGVATAGVVITAGLRLPLVVMRPVSLLSDAALPMMMLVLGMQLERATLPERRAVSSISLQATRVIAD